MTPTYLAHPSNYDDEEVFAILFAGPKDGPVIGVDADDFFKRDARRVARLLVAKCNLPWREAFLDAFEDAHEVVDDYFDEASDEDATVEAFVGEMPEAIDTSIKIERVHMMKMDDGSMFEQAS